MKILVTGGAGFIGSYLNDRLLKRGDEVVCIDNMSLGSKKNIQGFLSNPAFRLYINDLLDLSTITEIFKHEKFEMVYHLAANSDIQLGYNNLETDYNNTFLTTYNVLKCMKRFKVGKLVFASSSAIYGDHEELIHENTGPLQPVSNYGAAKLAAEAYISSFVNGYGIKAWIIRFPNVIGCRLTHGVIFDFINKLNANSSELEILGDGKQEKPYLFVSDLLNAIDIAISGVNDPINTFNVAPKTLSTVDFIAENVIKELNLEGVKISYTGGRTGWIGDVPKFQYDTTKIERLGWAPSYTSNEAVVRSIREELLARKS